MHFCRNFHLHDESMDSEGGSSREKSFPQTPPPRSESAARRFLFAPSACGARGIGARASRRWASEAAKSPKRGSCVWMDRHLGSTFLGARRRFNMWIVEKRRLVMQSPKFERPASPGAFQAGAGMGNSLRRPLRHRMIASQSRRPEPRRPGGFLTDARCVKWKFLEPLPF